MQQRLKPLEIKRVRKDYPQVNYVKEGIQYIELNRGCKRQCEFCWSDPNYKVFPVPKIESNYVQIWGENILYDPDIKEKIIKLGEQRVNKKVVYYGLGQGVDYRLIKKDMIKLLSENRIGLINNKKNWYKRIKIAWDLGIEEEGKIKSIIDLFRSCGYRYVGIFVLVNYKVSFDDCLYKLAKIKQWNCGVDDCPHDCTKRQFIPTYWEEKRYRMFRALCRDHNINLGKPKEVKPNSSHN